MSTEIPNRFDFQQAAEEIYRNWEKAGCFDANPNPAKKPYTIVIPPPNVTGALHLGHALNNTLQDIQIRWHRMRGFEALWIPGTDHAGIATQAVVERRLKEQENKTRHDLGRDGLVARIWQWKAQYETRILQQLKRLGSSCDWRRTRFTLDDMCGKAVRRTFYDLFAKQWIYRGKRLVNWDTYLQTAVSDDEVFHETVKGHFWHLKYPVIDPKPGEPTVVIIATTRPETMLGDTAVAVHPDPASALEQAIEAAKEKVRTAPAKEVALFEKQLEELETRKRELLPHLETLTKMAKDGRKVRLPLINREIPLVADGWAKPEMGSGCVKITPAHDPNDYDVAIRCGLPMINILLPDGKLNENAGPYAGLNIQQARQRVVADMEMQGWLEMVEDREIDLAHSDRSKTPIEPYLADQWFVRMEQLAQSAIDAVEDGRVKIFPPRYAKGYVDWLSEKRDWPVGRQLWWGHQIPIWSKTYDSPAECSAVAQRLQQHAAVNDNRLNVQIENGVTLHACVRDEESALPAELQGLGLVRQEDVLDTWFSSALWPHSTLGWPDSTAELQYFYPTSTLITSRDIITLWVARMVLMGLNNVGQIPFHEVFIHPKIMDGFGEGMSKSKGNGVDPIDIIDKFGADALRLGLTKLTTADTQDVRMPVQYECPHCQALIQQTRENRIRPRIKCDKCSKEFGTQWAEAEADKALPKAAVVSERFEVARNFCNKLWNASRFVMMNLEGFQPIEIKRDELRLEDQWILSRLATVTQKASESLQSYQYADAAKMIEEFAWDHYCSFYLEMAKPRLQDPATRALTQQLLVHGLDTLLRLLHPVMPFITEAIWQQLKQFGLYRTIGATSPACDWLMQAPWPEVRAEDRNEKIEEQFAQFASLLGAIREIRSRQKIPMKDKMQFTVRCSPELEALLRPMEAYFNSLAGAESVAWGLSPPIPNVNALVSLEKMDVYVDLSRFIDVAAEVARNEKLLQNLVKLIAGKEKNLANQNFVARAPAEQVEKERQSLQELCQQRQAAEEALVKLRSML